MQRNIPLCDLLQKRLIRMMEHDMEMFNRMDGLEGLPVSEPDHLPWISQSPGTTFESNVL